MWKPLQTRESFCPSLSPGEMLHTCSLSGNAANNRSLKDVLKKPTTKQWHFHYWELETDNYQHWTHSGRGELGESQPCLTFYWKLELQSVFWFHFYFCFILIRNCTHESFLASFTSLASRLEWAPLLLLNYFKNERTLMDHSMTIPISKWKLSHCNSTVLFFGSFLKLLNCLFWFVLVWFLTLYFPQLICTSGFSSSLCELAPSPVECG